MLLIFQLFLDSLVKSTLFIAVPFPLVYVFIVVMVTRNQARSIDRWKIFPDCGYRVVNEFFNISNVLKIKSLRG